VGVKPSQSTAPKRGGGKQRETVGHRKMAKKSEEIHRWA